MRKARDIAKYLVSPEHLSYVVFDSSASLPIDIIYQKSVINVISVMIREDRIIVIAVSKLSKPQ